MIVSDPLNPKAAKLMQHEIRKITNKPVKYVIYNHHDHISGGNIFKAEGAKYIGHINILKQLKDHPISNSAMQSIGCVAARMCHTNNCPAGIATQKKDLRQRLNIEKSAKHLNNFFEASTELMQVMARACGHDSFDKFNNNDLATWHREMALLSGVKFSGFGKLE